MGASQWMSKGVMVALGWTLLHFCWQGTAVAMMYALADRVTSKANSGVRYAVALLALALMPVAVGATLTEEMRIQARTQEVGGLSEASLRREFRVLRGSGLGTGLGSGLGVGLRSGLVELAPKLSELVEGRAAWLATPAEHLLPWIDVAWIAGVLLLAVRAFGGWWQLEHVRRRALMALPEEVELSFRRMAERVRVGREVALRVSAEVISPMAMGVWRATVMLPISALLRLPIEELEAVLAHELAHIRRWDFVCNLMQTAVESLLFFHPAVWRLSRTVRERREVCCDEIAVRSCADAVVYARALLRLEEQRRTDIRMAVALHGTNGSLLGRVKRVLGEAIPMEARMTSGVRIAAAGAVTIGLLLGARVSDAVALSGRADVPVMLRQEPAKAGVAGVSAAPERSSFRGERGQAAPLPVVRSSGPAILFALPVKDAQAAPVPKAAAEVRAFPEAQVALGLLARVQTVREPAAPVQTSPVTQTPAPAREAEAAPVRELATASGKTYMDAMRDAGYPMTLDGDLNLLVTLKALGVTPEYAKAMGGVGLGKPAISDLITLKSLGVTPEYVTGLRRSGIAPKDFGELVTERALGVTAEYSSALHRQGFGDLDVHELISMKAEGLTPEYAAWMKQQFPRATLEELRRAGIFHIDDRFLELAKAHGFADRDLEKLLRLKISGLLDQ